MREWTNIAFSSIYHLLNRLEAAGWLESARHVSSDRPARKVYQLTPAGWKVFTQSLLLRLSSPRPNSTDFALALANLGCLPQADILVALSHHRTALCQRLEHIQTKQSIDRLENPHLPWFVSALFEYSEMLVTAEVNFISYLENQRSFDQPQEPANE